MASIAVGLILTSFKPYWTAIFGMMVGAGVYAAISAWQTWRTLKRADYYNYSAW
jgi:hypothetical protein